MLRIARARPTMLLVGLVWAAMAGCGGDGSGPSDDLIALAVGVTDHESGSTNVLTVTQLLGPRGARVGNVVPGLYVARGTYNLTGIGGPATIELTFAGTYGYEPGDKHDHVASGNPPTGNFEVSVKVGVWEGGAGNPRVCIYPGSQVGGSSIDCVRVF